jgi:plastocyanin
MRKIFTVLAIISTTLLFVFTPVKTNATTHLITVQSNFFSPDILAATVGDTIHFQWISGFHTTTCDDVLLPGTLFPPGAATWDAPMTSGTPDFFYVLTVEGTYEYGCQPHYPGMAGTINVAAGGPITYAWNRTDSSDFQVATNWTPTRTTPAADDILVFNNGATNTIAYNVPTQSIGSLVVESLTAVRFYNTFGGAANTLTISGGTNPVFQIEAGSTLSLSSSAGTTNALIINLNAGSTGNVSGNFTMRAYGGATPHRFNALDANAVTFESGSIFTFGPLTSGNSFGNGTGVSGPSSMIFASGSKYIFRSGSNPFGGSGPTTVTIFQSGSTYDHQSGTTPSFSGRSYANYEQNINSTITVSGNSAITIENITINDGTFNYNMTGRSNIKGNITIASGKTMNIAPLSNPSDSLFFNGTTQQSISGAGTFNITNTISIQNKVVLNNAAGLVLNKDVTIPGTLVLLSGNITTGANTLTLGTNLLILGTLARTSGTIIGNFSRQFAPSVVSNVLFPVGTATNYRPATISFTSNPFMGGTITINHTDGTDGSDLAVPFLDGAYQIDRRSNMFWTASSSFIDGVYTMSVDGNGQSGITNLDSLRLIYSPDGTTFSAPGTHVDGSGGSIASRSSLTGGAVGNFYLGGNNTNNPLPVELDNFVATTIKNEVILDWATGHELNNSGFEVQRASLIPNQTTSDVPSIANYESVGFVNSKGNSNIGQSYNFKDKNLQAGRYAYRLKQIDYNGNHTYFLLNNEVYVNSPGKFIISQNYPNPFNPSTTINYEMPFDGIMSLIVYDNLGREVKSLINGNINAGYHKTEFNAAGLPSGIYFYRVNATSGSINFVKVFKMILVK